MPETRPNPDALLAHLPAGTERERRGKLKIFFGYAAGVGKTYAMLEAARSARGHGSDVVVGYVEPHGRPETEALLEGFEAISPRQVSYRGVDLREFDLDAALRRRPGLILVDELAHSNAEGSRHAKRWQDIDELLDAGIDVWSTLNVQHLESLNDVIAQITGIVVRETIPDAVLERVDEIELIDITPEGLMDRLRGGKVYISAQAERALQSFFQRTNLVALRELSLRQAANRLRREVDAARQNRAAETPWATNERLLVCVGPSPSTARLVRTAKRMAAAFGAEWLAVAVDTTGAGVSEQIGRHFRLAEQLGAETHVLAGDNVAETILEYARSRNVTKIVVGKTAQPWWQRSLFGTVVDQLLEKSGDIDVYVIQGKPDVSKPAAPAAPPAVIHWPDYLGTALVVAACGVLGWLNHAFGLADVNTVMVFLLGVAFVAARFGRGPSIAAALASVLIFDFFFVPPYFTLTVSDPQYYVAFGVMLAIALLISTLTARLREKLITSQEQERRSAALYRVTKQLSEITGIEFLVRAAGQQLSQIFSGEIAMYLREPSGDLALRFGEESSVAKQPVNAIVAQWVAEHGQMAGAGTDTLPNATALFVPLVGSQRAVGALGFKPADSSHLGPEQRRLLETCASLIALSIERDQSILEANEAQLQVQAEQLRNSLLSSVSHDLRTPLAAIAGASSSLLEARAGGDDHTRRELAQSILEESHRLARLVDNLLDMTRLDAGAITPNKQWHVLEEIVGTARSLLRKELEGHPVQVDIPIDLPLLYMDGILIEQVLVNLLDNAARYTPPGTRIDISARVEGKGAAIRVADNGGGLPPGSEKRVFEKFFRGPAAHAADSRRGAGLGLAICKGIVEAHGGEMTARSRPGGGAEFSIYLPCERTAPEVVLDEVLAKSET